MEITINIETLRGIKGVGNKTLERIIEHHKKMQKEDDYLSKVQEQKPPKEWKIHKDNIYHGESVDFMRKNIPDNSVDLVVTSPPYDNLRDYQGYSFNYKIMLEEIYRVLKEGGVCVWVVGDASVDGSETGTSFRQALCGKEVGFNLHGTMIYEKNTSSFPASRTSNRYTQIFEYMFVLSKGNPKTANLICDKKNKWVGYTNWGENTARGKDGELKDIGDIKKVPEQSPRNNIWKYTVGGGFASRDKIAYKHPAIFPEKLAEDHILSWSNEGDIVLDPMCGSGTTCKMAKLNNRKFIGIDISEEYVHISKERIKQTGE